MKTGKVICDICGKYSDEFGLYERLEFIYVGSGDIIEGVRTVVGELDRDYDCAVRVELEEGNVGEPKPDICLKCTKKIQQILITALQRKWSYEES